MEFQALGMRYEIGVCIERQLLLRAFILPFFSLRYFDLVSKANYNLENTNIYIIVFPIQEFQRKDMSN